MKKNAYTVRIETTTLEAYTYEVAAENIRQAERLALILHTRYGNGSITYIAARRA